MREEPGYSLVEMVTVLAVASLLITASIVYGLPWLAREEMRSATYQVQTHLQLARIQAVSRNRDCAFQIDAGSRRIQVLDLNDPSNPADDVALADFTLPQGISFSDPEGGPPITLALVLGSVYRATFASDGGVPSGSGIIILGGGQRFDRISLFGAGGSRIETWNGSSWVTGA